MTTTNYGRADGAFEDTSKRGAGAGNQKAQQTPGQITGNAQQHGADAERHTDGALSSLGERMTGLAGSIRDRAPSDGSISNAANSVADGFESSGKYLTEHGVREMAGDVTDLVRKHPVRSLWIGVGIGALLAMALSRKS